MQADDGLAGVASALLEGATVGSIQAAPAAIAQQEQQQEDGHKAAFVTESTIITTVATQGQHAREISATIVLHKGEQASDVVHVVSPIGFDVFVDVFHTLVNFIEGARHCLGSVVAHGLL